MEKSWRCWTNVKNSRYMKQRSSRREDRKINKYRKKYSRNWNNIGKTMWRTKKLSLKKQSRECKVIVHYHLQLKPKNHSSFGKAVVRAKKNLPHKPTKWRAVVKCIARNHLLDIMKTVKNKRRTPMQYYWGNCKHCGWLL